MSDLKMGTAEARFADIIWEREPITSGQMAKIGAEEFNWKKSTSHTVLRRLCERGLFKNEISARIFLLLQVPLVYAAVIY